MPEQQPNTWIKRLQDESWEAELLVSIASIFVIFNGFAFLDFVVDFFINNLNPTQYFIGYMVCVFGYMGFGILGAFFVIHFSLRSYWIGLIGLSSVFPEYRYKDNKFSTIYNNKMSGLLPKIPDTINKLDEVCSVIFAAAFALLICYGYVSALSAILLVIYSYTSHFVSSNVLFIVAGVMIVYVVITALIYVLANLKKHQDDPKIQSWFYLSVIWNYKICYGPFYKYLLQTITLFTSNRKQKPSTLKAIQIMVVFGIGLAVWQLTQSNYLQLTRADRPQDESRLYTEHYASNNAEKTFLIWPEIQQQIISDGALALFVPILKYETRLLAKGCDLSDENGHNEADEVRQKRWRDDVDCYAKSLTLQLGEKVLANNFIKMEHPITGQFGLYAFIGLEHVKTGAHELSVTKKVGEIKAKQWHIPFYYSPK